MEGKYVEGLISLRRSLMQVEDSLLIVIDVQEHFLAKLLPEERRPLTERIAWTFPSLPQPSGFESWAGLLTRLRAGFPPDPRCSISRSLGWRKMRRS
jgi:hypothetical protein